MFAESAPIVIVLCLAAVVQSSTGFGFGLTSLALLTPIIGIRDAAIVTVLASLALAWFLLYKHRRHVRWRESRMLVAMVIVGVPLGVLFLVKGDVRLLKAVMGVILVASALQRLRPKTADKRWPAFLAIPCGLLSGAMNGAFGTGGPPVIGFLATQGYEHLSYVATLQLVFGVGGLIRLPELLRHAVLPPPMLLKAAIGVGATIVGALIGSLVVHRINEERMTKIVTALLLLLGVYYTISGFWG